MSTKELLDPGYGSAGKRKQKSNPIALAVACDHLRLADYLEGFQPPRQHQ